MIWAEYFLFPLYTRSCFIDKLPFDQGDWSMHLIRRLLVVFEGMRPQQRSKRDVLRGALNLDGEGHPIRLSCAGERFRNQYPGRSFASKFYRALFVALELKGITTHF